jgi:hypothetical protein
MSESIPQGWQGQQPGGYPPPSNAYDQQWGPQQPAPAQHEEPQEEVPSEFDYLFRGSAAAEPTSVMPQRGVTMQPPPPPQADYQRGYQQQEAYAPPADPYASQGYSYPQAGQQQADYQRNDTAANLVPGLGGPGGPYQEQFPDRRGWHPEPGGPDGGSRRTIGVVAGIAVVAVIVGISVAVFSSGGGATPSASSTKSSTTTTGATTSTASSGETAKQEADAIYSLITTAKSLRRQVGSAVDSAQRCVNEAQDAATLTSVSQQRQQLATKVATMPVDKLSRGSQLTSLLARAWNDSATDDADYAAWAQANANCKGHATSNGSYQQANDMTSQISTEKSQAVSIWNQVAVSAGEASISSTDL